MGWKEIAPDDFRQLVRDVTNFARVWAVRLSGLDYLRAALSSDDANNLSTPDQLVAHLALLNVLAVVKKAVGEQIDQDVHAAAQAGASYSEIAQALHMSRQNARRRWPDAAGKPIDPTPRPLADPGVAAMARHRAETSRGSTQPPRPTRSDRGH